MATNTRPELSQENKWWISKHRYYELRHFCLQYPEWVQVCDQIDSLPSYSSFTRERVDDQSVKKPTEMYAETMIYLKHRIDMVDKAAFEACDHQFWSTILVKAVTTGLSYDQLEAQFGIMPVSRNEWYIVYRKFFWLLDKYRE